MYSVCVKKTRTHENDEALKGCRRPRTDICIVKTMQMGVFNRFMGFQPKTCSSSLLCRLRSMADIQGLLCPSSSSAAASSSTSQKLQNAIWPIVFKLHMCIGLRQQMTHFDFEVIRSKVKVTAGDTSDWRSLQLYITTTFCSF